MRRREKTFQRAVSSRIIERGCIAVERASRLSAVQFWFPLEDLNLGKKTGRAQS